MQRQSLEQEIRRYEYLGKWAAVNKQYNPGLAYQHPDVIQLVSSYNHGYNQGRLTVLELQNKFQWIRIILALVAFVIFIGSLVINIGLMMLASLVCFLLIFPVHTFILDKIILHHFNKYEGNNG